MNVLVDTSIWPLALRRRRHDLNAHQKAAVVELTELVKEGRAKILGLVRQELLSGIKSATQFDKLGETMSSFRDETVGTPDDVAAAKASNVCRPKGIAVSVSDMLLCAMARTRGWANFMNDPDFENYAKVLGVRLQAPQK